MSARGIPEFAFNMALGRDAVAALRQGRISRPSGSSSRARGSAAIVTPRGAAKSLRPALVISIHHDSVQERYLEDWQFAGQPRRFSDRFSGFSIFVSEANAAVRARAWPSHSELGRSLTAAGLRFSPHHAENIPGENREVLDPDQWCLRVPQSAGS